MACMNAWISPPIALDPLVLVSPAVPDEGVSEALPGAWPGGDISPTDELCAPDVPSAALNDCITSSKAAKIADESERLLVETADVVALAASASGEDIAEVLESVPVVAAAEVLADAPPACPW